MACGITFASLQNTRPTVNNHTYVINLFAKFNMLLILIYCIQIANNLFGALN